MLKKIIRPLMWTAGWGFVFLLVLVLLGNYLLRQPRVQAFIIQGLAETTGFAVTYDKLQFSLKSGIGFSLQGMEAQALQGPEKLKAARVLVRLHTWELLRKRIRPTRIYLYQSRLQTTWPQPSLIEEAGDKPLVRIPSLKWLARLQSIKLEQSEILFSNRTFELVQLELHARQRKANPLVLQITSSCRIKTSTQNVPFRLTGTLSQDFRKGTTPALNLALEIKEFPLEWIPWPEFLHLKSGQMDARWTVKGKPDEQLNLQGQVHIRSLDLDWVHRPRSKAFPFASCSMDFQALIQGRMLKVPSLKMQLPQTPLSIAFNVDFRDRTNPFIESHLSAPGMSLKNFQDLFPGPVLPAWYEEDLFPLFTAGQVQVAELAMQGHTAAGSPDRYPATPGLIVKIDCRELEARLPGAAYAFESVQARVEIEKQALRIADFKARFGQSTIRHSGLESGTIFQDNPSFAVSLAGTFDVPELTRQLDIDLLKPQVPERLKQIAGTITSGTLICQAGLHYAYGEALQIRWGSFDFQEWQVKANKYLLPAQIKSAHIEINEQKADSFQAAGSWGHSEVETQGEFELSGQEGELRRLTLSGRADLNEILPLIHPVAEGWRFQAALPLQIDFERSASGWSAQGWLDLAHFSGENERVLLTPKPARLDFDLHLIPGRLLDVRKILFAFTENRTERGAARNPVSPVAGRCLIKSSYDLYRHQFTAWQVRMPSLMFEDLGLHIKEGDKVFKGEVACDLRFTAGRRDTPKRLDGWAKGEGVVLHAKALPAPISDFTFLWRFAGSGISIPLCKMNLGSSRVQISGELFQGPVWKGDLLLDVDRLKADDFRSLGFAGGPVRDWGKWLEKLDLDLQLQVAKGQWQEFKWGPLRADLNLGREGILIRKAHIQMEHGALETSGKVQPGERAQRIFSSKIQLDAQPIKEILPLLHLDSRAMEGKLNFKGLFYTEATNQKGFIPGTTGFGDLEIQDAVIQNSSALISILDFFSIKKIFKKRPPDVSKEGLYFEKIASDVFVNEGVIQTSNLYMKGPVINVLVPEGKINLNTQYVHFKILVQPLQVIDGIISHIPILGYILTGEDKTFITYQFLMEGPWKTAKPKYQPLKDLDKSVAGFIKRIFMTPGRLLKKITNGSQDSSRSGTTPLLDD